VPRLFVAVWPPPDVVDRVAALPRPPLAGLRWTDPEQWHVTLRFLGRVDEAAPVHEALTRVVAAPVEAVVGPAVGRFGHRVLHVSVDGLGDLAAAVVAAAADLGEPPEDRTFSGHLTLARVRRGGRVDLRPLAGTPVEGRWPVTEFTLVESRPGGAGARYDVVGRYPLRG
jgi:2'-5' RNA ligase